MPNLIAQDAYHSALDWIMALPFGSAFTRVELFVEMQWRHMYPESCKGSWNLAIANCVLRHEIIAINDDRWMRI